MRSVCSEADDTFTPLEMEISNSLYIEFDNPAMKMTQFWITLGGKYKIYKSKLRLALGISTMFKETSL